MDLLGIGTAVSGVANAISTGVQNRKNRRFQREMFDKTNEYNTPIQQVKRMKEAGLNPALMYQGSPQNVAQQVKVPEGQAPQIDPSLFAAIADISKTKSQTALTNETAAQMSTKTELLNANIATLNTKIDLIKTEIDRNKATIPNIEANTANTLQNTQNAILSGQEIQQRIKTAQQQYQQSSELFPISKQHAEQENQKQKSEIQRLNQEIDNFPAQQKLLFTKMAGEIRNLGKDATSKDYENLFRSYDNELRKANITPSGNFVETLIKWTALMGAKVTETFTGKNRYNNQNR